jgi:hypothetical protein
MAPAATGSAERIAGGAQDRGATGHDYPLVATGWCDPGRQSTALPRLREAHGHWRQALIRTRRGRRNLSHTTGGMITAPQSPRLIDEPAISMPAFCSLWIPSGSAGVTACWCRFALSHTEGLKG